MVDICIAVIYLAALRKDDFYYNLGLTLICAGLALSALYLYSKSKLLSDSLYTLPLLSFLSGAEKRLRFMRPWDWFVVIPLLILLGTGGGLVFTLRLSHYIGNPEFLIVMWILFFTGLVVFSFIVSGKDWAKEHGKLLDEVMNIRQNLTMEMNKQENPH